MEDTNLIRLLKLTADNKSVIVQALRKEIVKYSNTQEAYISEIEMENFELIKKCIELTNCLLKLKQIFIMTKNPDLEKCIFNPKCKILFETPTYLA